MASKSRVPTFMVSNRTYLEHCLRSARARIYCKWTFNGYSFESEDVALIQQMNCQVLRLWHAKYNDNSRDHNLRQEILSAFLSLQGVEKLIIDMVTINSFSLMPDLYRFVFRAPISQSLKNVCFILSEDVDHTLARGLEHASSITTLKIDFHGNGKVNYVYQYFRSASLKEIRFMNAPSKDCIALMREKRNMCLEEVTIWSNCTRGSEVVSKYVSGVLLKEPTLVTTYGVFHANTARALSNYQKHLFKLFGLSFD